MKPLRPLSDTREIRMPAGMEWGRWVVRRCWGLFRVTMSDRTVRVDKLRRRGEKDEWSEVFSGVRLTRLDLSWSEVMVSKWIKAAMGRQTKKKSESLPSEPYLCRDRPALEEFLTATDGPDGKPREPSVLMVSLTPDGVRAGLKDEDLGGWCWRTGVDLAAALDSIEKALQGEQNAFRGPRPTGQRKKK